MAGFTTIAFEVPTPLTYSTPRRDNNNCSNGSENAYPKADVWICPSCIPRFRFRAPECVVRDVGTFAD